jgi:hypothetical protein
MPGDVVRSSENQADEAWRARIDVAIGSYEPLWDGAHAFYDSLVPRLG